MTDPDASAFRVGDGGHTAHHRSRLWDVRVWQWAGQLAVVAVAVVVVVWAIANYRANSERLGIPTGLGFLDNPTSFEITGNDLSQNAPVRDAYVQGVLNTLRIAVAGIVAATVLGTVIGIGRLSHNWLVRQVATVYVESVRNVPLPLFVVFGALAVVLGVFPRIQEAWTPLGMMVVSNRGIAGPWFAGPAPGLIALAAAGLLAAWLVARWRRRVADRTGAVANTGLWAAVVFVAVLLTGWFAFGYTVTLPEIDGRRSIGGIRIDPSFFAIFLALVVYTASHIAEIVRGSIQAVPRGQGEAAHALALTGFQRMWHVVLPQAFRIAIPPVGNQYLNLIKNSSLGAGIGYYDITLVTQTTVGNGSPAVPAFAITLAIYLTFSLVTSLAVNLANRRFAVVER